MAAFRCNPDESAGLSEGMCLRCHMNACLPSSDLCADCKAFYDEARLRPVDPEWAQDYQCDTRGCTGRAVGLVAGVGQFCVDHLAEEALA